MLRKNRNILKYTPTALALECLSAFLVAAILCITAVMYPGVSGAVPKSYGFFGTITAWGERSSALLHPILAVYVYLIVTGLGLIARRMAVNNNPRGILQTVLIMLLCIKSVWLLFEAGRTYSVMLARELPVWAGFITLAGFGLTAIIGAFTILRRRKTGRASLSDGNHSGKPPGTC